MKNLISFVLGLFGVYTTINHPKNIGELEKLADKVCRKKTGAYNALLEYVKSVDKLSVDEFCIIYNKISSNVLTNELTSAICEKVKRDKNLFKRLGAGQLSSIMEKLGLCSIIDLIDSSLINDGKEKSASIELLNEIMTNTCWAHRESYNSRKAYTKYFSFGDGKDLLEHKLAPKFLCIIDDFVNVNNAKELVNKKEMSKQLFEKIYKDYTI